METSSECPIEQSYWFFPGRFLAGEYLDGVRVPFDLIEWQCKGEVYDDWSKKMKTSFVLAGQLVLRVCSEQCGWKKEWRDKEGERRV